MLLHPDGTEEVLVAGGLGSVTDPFISFDAQWCYYAYFPNLQPDHLNMQRAGLSHDGSDIYRINLKTRVVERLTHQEFTPSTSGGRNWDLKTFGSGGPGSAKDTLGYGILNLGPAPVAGGRVVFVSNRNGFQSTRGMLPMNLQLFVMDEDGTNVTPIAPMTLGSALHPSPLKDGRIMFSSLESQGLRDARLWGVWAIRPDGRGWEPLVSAFNFIQSFHFTAQLSNEDVVVEDYYGLNNAGFGTLYRFPTAGFRLANRASVVRIPARTRQSLPRASRNRRRTTRCICPLHPKGIFSITPFTNGLDRPSPRDAAGRFVGKVTQPSGAPLNDLLVVWSSGPVNTGIDAGHRRRHLSYSRRRTRPRVRRTSCCSRTTRGTTKRGHALSYRIKPSTASTSRPRCHGFRTTGRSVKSFQRARRTASSARAASTSARASRRRPGSRRFDGLDAFNSSDDGSSNWVWQGSDAGKYTNADIWAVRILALEPTSHQSYGPNEGRSLLQSRHRTYADPG